MAGPESPFDRPAAANTSASCMVAEGSRRGIVSGATVTYIRLALARAPLRMGTTALSATPTCVASPPQISAESFNSVPH